MVILHFYYSPLPWPAADEQSVASIAKLLENGMLRPSEREGGYETTSRGDAWVEMICHTPHPEAAKFWLHPITQEVLSRYYEQA